MSKSSSLQARRLTVALILASISFLCSILWFVLNQITFDRSDFSELLALRQKIVSEMLQHPVSVGRQIVSRTTARNLLQQFEEKTISYEDYIRATKPILKDALQNSEHLASIMRFDSQGRRLLYVGDSLNHVKIPEFSGGASFGPLFVVEGSWHILVTTPILAESGDRIGHDLIAYDLKDFAKFLQATSKVSQSETAFMLFSTAQESSPDLIFYSENLPPQFLREDFTRVIHILKADPDYGTSRPKVSVYWESIGKWRVGSFSIPKANWIFVSLTRRGNALISIGQNTILLFVSLIALLLSLSLALRKWHQQTGSEKSLTVLPGV